MHSRKSGGFTLIELLIAIAIIGLIATFAMLGLSNSRERARDTKRINDLRQFRKALELAFNQGNGYPVEASAITLGDAGHQVLCGKGSGVGFQADKSPTNCDADKVYVGLIPPDPSSDGAYTYVGTPSTFCIEATLEVGTDDLPAGTLIADQESLRSGTCP